MQEELDRLTKDVQEANARLKALSDAGQIDHDELYVEILGIDYEPQSFILVDEDKDNPFVEILMINYSGVGSEYRDLEVSENYFRMYLRKLRIQCEKKNVSTYEDLQAYYKSINLLSEVDELPLKLGPEIFTYSEDPRRTTVADTQELFWQNHGE